MSNSPAAFPDPEPDHGTDPSSSSGGNARRSRLDREVDEILSKSVQKHPLPPISFKQRVAQKQAAQAKRPDVRAWRDSAWHFLTAMPLFTALGLAILCTMVGDYSPLLARLLAIAAVVMVVYPLFRQARSGATQSSQKMWRGRTMDAPGLPPPPVVDRIKHWFQSRPPR